MAKITYIGYESGDRGEIVKFDINGKRYEYNVGFFFMERIDRLARHASGRALNLAKQSGELVKTGRHHIMSIEDSTPVKDKN